MSHRLEPHSRTVTWTETRTVTVGYHSCGNCGKETPAPTDEDLLAFAKTRPHGGYFWPGTPRRNDEWSPPGWSDITGDRVPGGSKILCEECTSVALAALATRAKP